MSLSTIVGSVTDLKITGTTYEDVIFTPNTRNAAGAAATGAVLLGELASAAILSSTATSGAEIAMTGFSCTANDVPVVGAFYNVGFSENEVIEFVGEMDKGKFLAVAARSESQKIIWTIPYHDCGHIALSRKGMRFCLIFSLFFAFAISAAWAAITGLSPKVPLAVNAGLPAIAFTMSMIITLWVRSHFTKSSKNATLIFGALGFPRPGEVDLPAIHKLADEKFRQEGNVGPPIFGLWCYRY